MRFACYDFNAARHRTDAATLSPPFRAVRGTPIDDVGYLPLFADGRLFVAYERGTVAALDAGSLESIWELDIGAPFEPLASTTGACLLVGDALVVATDDALFVIDPATGVLRNQHPLTNFDVWGSAILDHVLVGQYHEDARELAAYDLRASRLLWHRPIGANNALLAADAGVVCRLEHGAFAAADVATGEDRWTFPVSELGRYTDALGETLDGAAAGRPIIADGAMIGSVLGHHIVSIDLASGNARWVTRCDFPNTSNLSYTPAGEIIVIGDRSVITLDARTGTISSAIDIAPAIDAAGVAGPFSRPGITTEFLYCGDYRGELIAINRTNGTIDWKTKCRARIPIGFAPLVLGARLYVVDARGYFYAFDGQQ